MSDRPRVAVLDYGMGNVHSAVTALREAGADAQLSCDREYIRECDGVVVPGVGAFGAVMSALSAVNGDDIIDECLSGNKPTLGICVGMQVLFEWGTEHGTRSPGLGYWPGEVTEVNAAVLPHMGWNTVTSASGSRLFAGIEAERFYFVHSYAAGQEASRQAFDTSALLSWCDYGSRFLAAAENGSLSATQFHPEKSGHAGIYLLRNWLTTFTPDLSKEAPQ